MSTVPVAEGKEKTDNSSKLASTRVRELDSLRGLAAISVVFSHYILLISNSSRPDLQPIDQIFHLLTMTPLSTLWSGTQAVLLFFVLSGFVLTLMLNKHPTAYSAYVAKRICRLWIPYVAAIAVAALLIQTFGSRVIPELGSWINELLGKEVTIGSLTEHLFFIGHYDTKRYDFAIWSLVQEMRISLIFPALLAVVLWIPWKWALASALALSAVSMVVYRWVYLAGYSLLGTYPITGHCLLFFVIGILLATHREAISAWYGQLNTRHRGVLAIAGIVSYSCLPQIPHLLGVKNGGPSAWLATPGVVVVMIFALASPRAGRPLRLSMPSFLGRISYSLYLYHGIVILAALNIGYGRVPIGVLILLMFMATLAISTLSYYWIEVPAMSLGGRLSRRLDRSKNQVTGDAIPQRP